MSYDAFLLILSQFSEQNRACITVQDTVICVALSEDKKHWTFSTKVYQGDGFVPHSVRACVAGTDLLRWKRKGAYLAMDLNSSSVKLLETIHISEQRYLSFRAHFPQFLQSVADWRDALNGEAEKDLAKDFR